MSSADSEVQRDELDALTSILEETTFEIDKQAETTQGTLVIEVTLPDQFYIQYHQSITKLHALFLSHSVFLIV